MYFGYCLNKGMLKALGSCFLPLDFILPHSNYYIWLYTMWLFQAPKSECSKNQTTTNSYSWGHLNSHRYLKFLFHAKLSNAADLSTCSQAWIDMLLLSKLGQTERMKEKDEQGGHYVTVSSFQDAVLRKSSGVHALARTASWCCCFTEEEGLQKAHTTGSQALQRAPEAGKYQTTTYSKPSNNRGSFWHLLTLEMYLQPTPAANRDKEQPSIISPQKNGSQAEEGWRLLPEYLTILVSYCTDNLKD